LRKCPCSACLVLMPVSEVRHITIAKAARILKLSPHEVASLADAGVIEDYRIGDRRMVDQQSVESYAFTRGAAS
jgi:hypothetical protein